VESANLTTVSERNQAKLERIRQWLVRILRAPWLPAVERAAAGNNLARLGDPRAEVTTVEALELCMVPAGPFWMGSGEEDPQAQESERPAHEMDIPYSYWVSRFPVTVAQFEQFCAAGGYGEERYWPEAIEAAFWKAGAFKGRYKRATRKAPHDFGEPFNLANHPVVGVTWYEALAFCRWLTDVLREKGAIPGTWEARLPSEAEWEKAARGGYEVPGEPVVGLSGEPGLESNRHSNRVYPWTGSFDPERASTVETGIQATVAVGCFPQGQSEYGCQDLSGNVWEWTLSLYEGYPYQPRDGRENLNAAPDHLRVLRGGSWFNYLRRARCSCRYGSDPLGRYYDVGFRVVVSPFSSEL
jgi:formylglycine-generating enzyme required for sulfatase activity